MAYNRGNRFPPPQQCCRLLDPGAYQIGDVKSVKPNKVPFLSRTPRKTAPCGRLWTEAIYDTGQSHKIANCSSLKSKCPRFPYEAFSKEDLEALLCRCGIQSECECKDDIEEGKQDVLCQGKVRKRILIGPTPKITSDKELPLLPEIKDESPPFYNANVIFSTDFYHGCKWSKWTGKRSIKYLESGPGPADYFYVKQPADFEICSEKFREYRRLTSKQLRFIEMVQARNILEGRPGPASYHLEEPKRHEMLYLGPKSERFKFNFEQRPGPADYDVKRTFDLPKPPKVLCHAKLPEPSFFGIKAIRFKPRYEEGPSPATYNPVYRPCTFMHCPIAPFGSSSIRFKETPTVEEDDEDIISEDEPQKIETDFKEPCRHPTWGFKSKTIRMKPLKKMWNEPSPADLSQSKSSVRRSNQLQYLAPFHSSEGRFQAWKNWMSVHGGVNTPGTCYYEWKEPKCYPAVTCGPLQRAPRFSKSTNENPAPNTYKVKGGIESILFTHNQKLKDNIKNQHTFKWKPPIETKELSYEEQEQLLLDKSIALLDIDSEDEKKVEDGNKKETEKADENEEDDEIDTRKWLRCFIYGQETPHCI